MLLKVVQLETERRVDPIGIGEPSPRLSWRLESDHRATEQTAYQVQVARSATFEDDDLLWDPGWALCRNSLVQYAGPTLKSRERAYWRLRVVDNHQCTSPWSKTSTWEVGLLHTGAWSGRWIGYVQPALVWGADAVEDSRPSPYLRRSFRIDGPIREARAYATALGLYELHVNGRRVGDELLTPGWTDYRHRIQYQTYDIGEMLRPGENVIGAILADGWYAGQMASFGGNHYGDAPALLCELDIELESRETMAIVTDGSWRAWASAASLADLLMGERVDGRLEPLGWDSPDFDDTDWAPVQFRASPRVPIVAPRDDGVRVLESRFPVSTIERAPGRFVLDFGQNLAGHLRVEASEPRGATLSIRHAEVLDEKGELYTANLRSAEATDAYTFRGDGSETYEPRFTYHGFRYAELAGLSEPLLPGQVRAVAISSACRTIGSFECSDPLVNQIHTNVVWGLRDNFISIPTDCPQRDERLGWAADVQVFAPSALFIADVANTLEKWLIDLADAQLPSGVYPDTAPHVGHVGAGNAGWADAGVLVPWALYEATGDRTLIDRQYPSMRRYLEFLESDHTAGIRSAGRLGDWLNLGAQTHPDLIGTAYLAWTSGVFTRIARLVGQDDDAERSGRLSREANEAFIRSFVLSDGTVSGDTQTGYALALGFGLLPEPLRQSAADQLAILVDVAGGHLTTGFLGVPLVLAALSNHGHHGLACRLVRSDAYPGWGYEIRQGATTIWERWNGWTEEHGFADPGMNSFNHFAFGSVADWLHRYVAGLAPAEPGYGRTLIQPRPTSEFTWARAQHESAHGLHAVAWDLAKDALLLTVDVPPNTSADIVLPAYRDDVSVDGRSLDSGVDGVGTITTSRVETRFAVGSGRYVVKAALPASVDRSRPALPVRGSGD
jgi:alpha-L-rhamnosidase